MTHIKGHFVTLTLCSFILITTISCSSENIENASNNINATAQLTANESDISDKSTSEESVKSIEEKAPWDITGSWCEDSVENGGAGMAAYVSDDSITIFHVSDNAFIRTPYWICNYEQQQTNTFELNTTIDSSLRADCVLLSVDDEKKLTYSNEKLSFYSSLGDKELKRTEIDFSGDYHTLPSNSAPSSIEIGGLSINIPKSFGFYTSNNNDNNGETVQCLSSDAVLTIVSLQPEDIDLNNYSDKDYKNLIAIYTKTVIDGFKKLLTNSSIEYDEDTTIFDSPAHMLKARGVYKDRLDGYHYMATFGNKEANYAFSINMMVSGNTTHDYESDFNDIIASIKSAANTSTTNNITSNNVMPAMTGSSIDLATKKAKGLGVKELSDEDFGHGTRCKSLSDSTGGLTIDIIYSSTSKELLCASISTVNIASSGEQKKFVKEMAPVLCPESDSTTVSSWVQNNVGSSQSTYINNFTYETAVGPSNNILYYAGYTEWEAWDLTQ